MTRQVCLRVGLLAMVAIVMTHGGVRGADAVTPSNFEMPSANRAEEAVAEEYSLTVAGEFLDAAALGWFEQKKCFTCHTNFAYLMARPRMGGEMAAHAAVRGQLEDMVRTRWEEKGPRWDAEVVMAAAALATGDALGEGKLEEATRTALDRMWTVQREDGGVDWLKCDWPPMEIDDHYGATMMAIAAGVAPEGYAETPAAQAGLEKLKGWLEANPAAMLHHRAMLLWAATEVEGLLDRGEQTAIVEELLSAQQEDGGWCLADLGQWEREDGGAQDTETSDGYATGFAVFVARKAGVPADDARIGRGVAWLKSNQRASGRWFTRSQFDDEHHYISHAGTAMAVMALSLCE